MECRINKEWTLHAVISRGEHRDSTDGTDQSRSSRVHRRPRDQEGFEERPVRSHEGTCRSRGDMAGGGAPNGEASIKQMKMLRATGGDESRRRRRRSPTTEVKRLWTVFTTTTALLQLKATRTTRATKRISAMLDPMTRALLRSPTLLADTGGARLGATAARRAVRLQRSVYAWFGEGFLYIGYVTLRRGGVQNELAGHLVNHTKGDTAEADKLRDRMAKRKALGELQDMILPVADEPEARLMESTPTSTISPNADGRRATTRNADPRARARRRRPRFRERTVIPCLTRGIWDRLDNENERNEAQ